VSSGGKLAFSHLSFQEYLASRDFLDPSGNLQKRALHSYLVGGDWWLEVLVFHLSASSRPAEVRKWVLAEAKKTLTVSESANSRVQKLFLRLESSNGELV
jgi:predicted NACHT family NTPase